MAVDYLTIPMQKAYADGRQFFWARRGQKNQSCASCHVDNAGNRLGLDVIGPALGQGTGFPGFSLEQSVSGDRPRLRSLHQQYRKCMARVGAEPLALGSSTFIALEVYQGIINSGVPIGEPLILK